MDGSTGGADDSSSFPAVVGLCAVGGGAMYGGFIYGRQKMHLEMLGMADIFNKLKTKATRKSHFLKLFPEETDFCNILDVLASNSTDSNNTDNNKLLFVLDTENYITWLFDGMSANYTNKEYDTRALFEQSFQENFRVRLSYYVTKIESLEQTIAERNQTIVDRDQTIAEHIETIARLRQTIAERGQTIVESNKQPLVKPPTANKASTKIPAPVDYIKWLKGNSKTAFPHSTGLEYYTLKFRELLLQEFKNSPLSPLLERCQAFELRKSLDYTRRKDIASISSLKSKEMIVKQYANCLFVEPPSKISLCINNVKSFPDTQPTSEFLTLLCSIIDDVDANSLNSL